MDFASLLKQEIASKKRKVEEANVLKEGKKYYKKSDLEAARFKKSSEDQAEERASPSECSTDDKKVEEEEKVIPPRKDVIKRLRTLGHPIRLFGESDEEAFERLRQLEMLSNEGMSDGRQNDFRLAIQKVDDDYINELAKGGEETGPTKIFDVKCPTEVDFEDLKSKYDKFIRSRDVEFNMSFVLNYLKFHSGQWANQLNARIEEEKSSHEGKLLSATYSQSMAYLKPLLRQLKHKNLSVDILESLREIIVELWNRNYIKAYERYLEMAIGNAAWPIGVGYVGIHARPGREKSSSKYIAHVLNDETQRKYITGLKRLMSKIQDIYPTDPHRSVNFDSHKQR